jgi:hypothetical protein
VSNDARHADPLSLAAYRLEQALADVRRIRDGQPRGEEARRLSIVITQVELGAAMLEFVIHGRQPPPDAP